MLCFKINNLKFSKLFSAEFTNEFVLASIINTSFIIDINADVLRESNARSLQNLLKINIGDFCIFSYNINSW